MFYLSRLLTKFDVYRFCIYWACWVAMFLVFMIIVVAWPKAALWLMGLTEPLSQALREMFWAFAPEDSQPIRKLGKVAGWFGRKAMSTLSDRNQVVVHATVLNGLLVVSIAAWIAHRVALFFLKRRLIREFYAHHDVVPRLESEQFADSDSSGPLGQDRREPQF